MNWAAIRPAIVSAIQAATGIQTIVWKGAKEDASWAQNGIVARLSVSSTKGVGTDVPVATWDAATKTRTMTLEGMRQFTLTVRIETQDQTDAGWVGNLADTLRVRIRRQSNLNIMRAVGVSIASIQPTTVVENIKVQSRVLSVAVMDFIMNSVENDVDVTTGSSDWIQSASITGSETREDGTIKSVDTEVTTNE